MIDLNLQLNEYLKNPLIQERFKTYYETLIEWNQKFNLTAIVEEKEVYLKHFADSLAASALVKEGSVLDIGAGAGFPSLPLKIVNDKIEVIMADSLNKRIGFLEEVIKKLKLKNITAIHTRAEDIKKDKKFDFAVARAVAPMNTLVEYMLPFIKKGGLLIAYKADKIEEEVEGAKQAVKELGGDNAEIIKMRLDAETVRSIVKIKKISETPEKYPRSGNKPKINPL